MKFNQLANHVLDQSRFWEEEAEISNRNDLHEQYPFEKCLRPLLAAMNWSGQERHILQALPTTSVISDPAELSAVLQNLGYELTWQRKTLATLRFETGTVIVLIEDNRPLIAEMYKVRNEDDFLAYDVMQEDHIHVNFDDTKAIIGFVKPISEDSAGNAPRIGTWFQNKYQHMRPAVINLMFTSFIINAMAVATPLYVMSVYNLVIAPKELETLWFFTIAILASVSLEYYFRMRRGEIISYIGARFIAVMVAETFARVISLPLSFFSKAPTSAQVERFKQFGNAFSFFRAGLINVLMDFPFLIMFLGLIWLLGGSVMWVPVGITVAFCVLGIITFSVRRQTSAQASNARIQLHNTVFETFENAEAIRQIQGENRWAQRYSRWLLKYLSIKHKSDILDSVLRGVSLYLTTIGGVLCLFVGASKVMENEMSVGALIALMMMIWRLLSPIQTLFLSWLQVFYIKATVQQVNNIMRLQEDRKVGQPSVISRSPMRGDIAFQKVVLRYPDQLEPTLNGLDLIIPAGSLVCIGEADESQATNAIIDSLLSLVPINAGNIYVDTLNLRQINVEDVRHMISLVTPEPYLFQGTIRQNICFGYPMATDDDVRKAIQLAGLPENVADIDTFLTFGEIEALPSDIAYRLSLAQAYCRPARVYIFYDPDFRQTSTLLTQRVRAMRHLNQAGATVIMLSDRQEIFDASDRAIILSNGCVVADETPQELMRRREEQQAKRAMQQMSSDLQSQAGTPNPQGWA